jgi:hypothetical protein
MTQPVDACLRLADEVLAAAMDYFGPIDDPSIGWCDPKTSDPKLFRCEKCGAEHLDCAMISHIKGCRAVRLRDALIAAASSVGDESGHATQDNYEHFLAYGGLDHSPLLQYAYFHGADVGMEKPKIEAPALQAAMQGWQAMDSAPMDGSSVLIFCEGAGVPAVAFFCEENDEWMSIAGESFAHPVVWQPAPRYTPPTAAEPGEA